MRLLRTSLFLFLTVFIGTSFAAPMQTYKPGFITGFSSGGELGVGYAFGNNAQNIISLHTSYSTHDHKNSGTKAGTTYTDDVSDIPVAISFSHLIPIKPAKFDNKFFCGFGVFYGQNFGEQKITTNNTSKNYSIQDWFTGIHTLLEYRLTSNLAIGGGIQIFNYNHFKTKDQDNEVNTSQFFRHAFTYVSYRF